MIANKTTDGKSCERSTKLLMFGLTRLNYSFSAMDLPKRSCSYLLILALMTGLGVSAPVTESIEVKSSQTNTVASQPNNDLPVNFADENAHNSERNEIESPIQGKPLSHGKVSDSVKTTLHNENEYVLMRVIACIRSIRFRCIFTRHLNVL